MRRLRVDPADCAVCSGPSYAARATALVSSSRRSCARARVRAGEQGWRV